MPSRLILSPTMSSMERSSGESMRQPKQVLKKVGKAPRRHGVVVMQRCNPIAAVSVFHKHTPPPSLPLTCKVEVTLLLEPLAGCLHLLDLSVEKLDLGGRRSGWRTRPSTANRTSGSGTNTR